MITLMVGFRCLAKFTKHIVKKTEKNLIIMELIPKGTEMYTKHINI